MKPVTRKVMKSSVFLQEFNAASVIAKIKGSVNKLGAQYKDATVVLYSKANLQPIAVRKPDINGDYQFLGLNADLRTFIVAFDKNQQFNAIIQDNVVPK